MYSPLPAHGVTQPVHQALEDAGFKFDKFGAKTDWPLYKDTTGKAVYVSDAATSKYEYYPMGTHGTNPYGSSKGEGLAALKNTLAEPFEKPEQFAPTTPAFTAPMKQKGDPAISLDEKQKATYKDLPIDNTPQFGSAVVKLTSGETTGGDTAQHVAFVGSVTPDEKHSISEYKGSTYHSINSFLWSAGQKGNGMDNHVKNIASVIEKGKLNKDMVLWRGIKGTFSEQIAKQLLDGADTLSPKCFQSTSTSQSFSHDWAGGKDNVVFKIHAPAGTSAASVQFVQHHSSDGEYEIILGAGVTYKVNSVYKSNGRIYADVKAVYPSKGIHSMAADKYTHSEEEIRKPLTQAEMIAKIKAAPSADDADLACLEAYKDGLKLFPKE